MANHFGRETEELDAPPQIPESVADAGVPRSFLEELLLKTLYLSGPFTFSEWVRLARLNRRVSILSIITVAPTNSVSKGS